MTSGDLVRFKSISTARRHRLFPLDSQDGEWRIGLLIEYHTWEKVATVLYRGQTFRMRAEFVQKAGKKDESR